MVCFIGSGYNIGRRHGELLHLRGNYEGGMATVEPVAVLIQTLSIVKLCMLTNQVEVVHGQEIYQTFLAMQFYLKLV